MYINDIDTKIQNMFLNSLTLNIILNGDINISAQRNIEIHTAVSKYIMKPNCLLNIFLYFNAVYPHVIDIKSL